MPLSRLLQALNGTCHYCGQKVGLLQRDHPECRRTHTAGIQEMTQLAAQSALRQTLQAIAQRSHATGEDIDRALEEGGRQALTDGIMTREDEERLRAFRDHLALRDNAADQDAIWDLEQASGHRLMIEARLAAISVHDGDQHLQELDGAMLEGRLEPHQRRRILIPAWEAAVEGALEGGLVSLDQENALASTQSTVKS